MESKTKQTSASREAIKKVWNDNFFLLFMSKRFPNETAENYIKEWADRLKTGNPFGYMDKETTQAYKDAVEEYTGGNK